MMLLQSAVTTTPSESGVYRIYGDHERQNSGRTSFHQNFSTPLAETFKLLKRLRAWGAGWNGYDVDAPNPNAVVAAEWWIGRMYDDVFFSFQSWQNPHVTASEDGDVLFEWWYGEKGLSIYINGDGETYYIKDWGPNIVLEMEDGEANTARVCKELWLWLTN